MNDLRNKKTYISASINVLLFVISLFIIGILLGMAVNLINGEFSFRIFRIAIINAVFFSLGVLLNIIMIRILMFKLNHGLLFFLSFILILGISISGFILVVISEPLFFLDKSRLVYSYLLINFLFIITISITSTGFLVYQKTINIKEKKIMEEQILRKQMESKLYASKINPHFLFNSLNLIISTLGDKKKAEKVLISLSGLLRYNLDASAQETISLTEEIKNVEKYLYIQKLRFEERLEYSLSRSADKQVPPLIIQPLVENCIKHNIKNVDILRISIDIYEDNGVCIIDIKDSCRKLVPEMVGNGVGLATTKKRVELSGGSFSINKGMIRVAFAL